MAGAAGGKLLRLSSAGAGRSLGWGKATRTGEEAEMVGALCRPGQPSPVTANTELAREALSPQKWLVQPTLEPGPAPGSWSGTRISGEKAGPL